MTRELMNHTTKSVPFGRRSIAVAALAASLVVAVFVAVTLSAGGNGGKEAARSGRVSAVEGGTVTAADGVTSVFFPAGSLPADTTISLSSDEMPERDGFQFAGAASFEPHGMEFRKPAMVTMALSESFEPGTLLKLFYFEEREGRIEDLGPLAKVNAGGRSASAPVVHFSTYAVGHSNGDRCKYDHTRYFPDQASAQQYANNVQGISGPDFYYIAEVAGPLDPAIYGSDNWAVNMTLCRRQKATPTPEPTAEPTQAPMPSQAPGIPDPNPGPNPGPQPLPTLPPPSGPTPEPTPEPTAAPTPEPTPAPTPAPQPGPGPQAPAHGCIYLGSGGPFGTDDEANAYAAANTGDGGEYNGVHGDIVATFRVVTLPPVGG